MLMPSIFGENLLDDLFGFDYPVKTPQRENVSDMMKTDVREYEHGYELDISLPGYKKEAIQAELKDGYLTIQARASRDKEEKDGRNGRYIRRERYTDSCSRSFYVGEEILREDIKAKYENGVLKLAIPKKEPKKPEPEEKKFIVIEG